MFLQPGLECYLVIRNLYDIDRLVACLQSLTCEYVI